MLWNLKTHEFGLVWLYSASARSDAGFHAQRLRRACVRALEYRREDAPPSATGPRWGRTSGDAASSAALRSGMDQGAAAGTGGTFISLSEAEQRCYSGLYALCQPDGTGTPAAGKVAELFRASQLPADTLHQVSEYALVSRGAPGIARSWRSVTVVYLSFGYLLHNVVKSSSVFGTDLRVNDTR